MAAARRRKRKQHLPEATAAAEAVARTLNDLHPDAPWIHQVCDGVIRLVEMSMRQLAGRPGPARNAQPFAEGQPNSYQEPARTTQEEIDAAPAAMPGRWQRALAERESKQEEPHERRNPDNDDSVRWLL